MSDEVIKVLDHINKQFGLGIDWTSKNVLPYVKTIMNEIVNYELWTSLVLIVLMTGLIILTICICKWLWNEDWDDDEIQLGAFIVGVGLVAFFLTVLICEVFDVVKCKTFPEMVVYEYVTEQLDKRH